MKRFDAASKSAGKGIGEIWIAMMLPANSLVFKSVDCSAAAPPEYNRCCTAQVTLRVALTRLLREVRPHRLLIEGETRSRAARRDARGDR
jgi:hypothetical protein